MREVRQARLVDTCGLSADTSTFTFASLEGRFQDCEAGAHVGLLLPNGLIRNYSLASWDERGETVTIAVKREPNGRGGSVAVHDLEVGAVLGVTDPRNNFPLRSPAHPVVLLGGGIGITPLYAMARELKAGGRLFDIRYLVRMEEAAALHDRLLDLDLGDSYRLHCDDVDGLPDFQALLAQHTEDVHVYVCGPEVMLDAVQRASADIGRGTLFFERFAAAPVTEDDAPAQSFTIELGSTGEELVVPAEKNILQVLREAGRDIDYSCSEGQCGTCITDVLEGEIDHRDSILTNEEREAGDCMTICVSRARGQRLLLDL